MKNLVEDEELEGNEYDVDNFINALTELSKAGDWAISHTTGPTGLWNRGYVKIQV